MFGESWLHLYLHLHSPHDLRFYLGHKKAFKNPLRPYEDALHNRLTSCRQLTHVSTCVELFNWCDGWFTTGFSDTPIINCSVPSLESQGTTMDWLLRRGTISSQNPGTWQPFDVLLVARPLLTCGNHQASPLRMPSSVPGFTAMSPGMRW